MRAPDEVEERGAEVGPLEQERPQGQGRGVSGVELGGPGPCPYSPAWRRRVEERGVEPEDVLEPRLWCFC